MQSSSAYLLVFRTSSTALSLVSIAVSRSSISFRIRVVSSFLGMYWLEGLRGDGTGSIGVGFNGSNGGLGSIGVGCNSRDHFDSFLNATSNSRFQIVLQIRLNC